MPPVCGELMVELRHKSEMHIGAAIRSAAWGASCRRVRFCRPTAQPCRSAPCKRRVRPPCGAKKRGLASSQRVLYNLQKQIFIFENQIREVVMNQTTKPAACPDSVRVERIQISHGRAIRVVSVFPKSGSQTAEEKLRVLAALELQRKKSA